MLRFVISWTQSIRGKSPDFICQRFSHGSQFTILLVVALVNRVGNRVFGVRSKKKNLARGESIMNLRSSNWGVFVFCVLITLFWAIPAQALDTAFTYQGQLKHDGMPVDDTVDLRFSLWDSASSGTQIGATVTTNGLAIVDGLFTVKIDFGSLAFAGDNRWLEVEVKGSSDVDYVTLTPRQQITAAPYSLWAASAQTGWGSGTTDYVSKFTGPSTLGNSVIREDSADGEIGIGVNPATALVHIHKPSDGAAQHGHLRLTNSLSGTSVLNGIEMSYWATNSRDAFLTNWEDGWFSFGTGGGVERMRIVSDGDVGIGTSDPSARLDVEGGSIAQLDSGPSNAYGKMSVFAQEGTLDTNGDFSLSIPSSLYQAWTYDNYVFKVEVFVSVDYDSVHPHDDKGAAYSMALVHKQRGAGLVSFSEVYSYDYDATISFGYSSPVSNYLRIDVDTNRSPGISYRATVKISH